jgi:2'-5' RNA ligase
MADQIYAVVSLLSGEARAEVRAIWELLEERFGARTAREATHPHITYVVGEMADADALAAQLAAEAALIAPLTVTIDGFGMFPGPPPVLFLRVVRDAALARVYERVMAAAQRAGLAPWPNYAPDAWVPHVTLAMQDLPPALAPQALAAIGRRLLRFQTPLGGLQIARVAESLAESIYLDAFPFGGSGGVPGQTEME